MKKTNWIAWLLVLVLAVSNISLRQENETLQEQLSVWKRQSISQQHQIDRYQSRSSAAYSSSPSYSTYVYVSRTGSKYHDNPNCSNMDDPDYVPLSEAIADGRTACSKCY